MDTEWKTTDLRGLASDPPSTVGLTPNTPQNYQPTRAVAEAQDGVAAGCRRVLGRWGLNGYDRFHVPSFGEPSVQIAAQGDYPDRDTWRSVASWRIAEVAPGCAVRARVYFVGSGQTQYEDGGTWYPAGPFGALRIRHTWTADDSTTAGPIEEDLELPPSPIALAAEPVGEAACWHALDYAEVELRPDDLEDDAIAAVWSERATLDLELQLRGAPRIVAVVVHEQPVRVSYAHDSDVPHAVNGQTAAESPQTQAPQYAAADGATYIESRFGTAALAQTAERQDQLGPTIMTWSAWNESAASGHGPVAPRSITSSTWDDIVSPGESEYDPARPGWCVAAAHAQQHALCDAGQVLGGDTAVVPVRVVVEAYITGSALLGTVRVQSGPYEWIDVEVDGLVPGFYAASGYLESQAACDHEHAILQAFGRVDDDSLEVLSITVIFGE